MIDYPRTPVRVWCVQTFCGGEVRAWPVQQSVQAALGQAVKAVHELLERDYTFTVQPLPEKPDAWLVCGSPDCPDGYPKKYSVTAYVLPSTLAEV